MMRSRRWSAVLWVMPAVLLLVVFVYYPIVENVRLILYKWDAFSPQEVWVGTGNYDRLFADPIFVVGLQPGIFAQSPLAGP